MQNYLGASSSAWLSLSDSTLSTTPATGELDWPKQPSPTHSPTEIYPICQVHRTISSHGHSNIYFVCQMTMCIGCCITMCWSSCVFNQLHLVHIHNSFILVIHTEICSNLNASGNPVEIKLEKGGVKRSIRIPIIVVGKL